MSFDLKRVLQTLDEFGPTFQKANDADPSTFKTAGADLSTLPVPSLGFMSTDDQMYVRKSLRKLRTDELGQLLTKAMVAGSGRGRPADTSIFEAASVSGIDTKALDTASGAALQRTDLDPILQELFLRIYPGWDRLRKVQANGVSHTWNQITDYGDSTFMSEIGTVTDHTSTFVRKTANIAVIGDRRGVTFKEALAVPAGGMSWDAQRIEIQNGLYAMAHRLQKTVYQGQSTNSGGTASNEYGLYDANAFDGFRSQLNTANAVNASPYLTSSPDSFVSKINDAIVGITDVVGVAPTAIHARQSEIAQFINQQLSLVRIVDRVEYTPGVMVPAVATVSGLLPLVGIPGDSIGTYTASTFSNKTVADMYVLNEDHIVIPYLGGPGPSVIEIPPGVSGQLTRLFILWFMGSLAVLSLPHSSKIRCNTATS
jgi:hypothetical protein